MAITVSDQHDEGVKGAAPIDIGPGPIPGLSHSRPAHNRCTTAADLAGREPRSDADHINLSTVTGNVPFEHYSAPARGPAEDSAGCRAPISYVVTLMVHTTSARCAVIHTAAAAGEIPQLGLAIVGVGADCWAEHGVGSPNPVADSGAPLHTGVAK